MQLVTLFSGGKDSTYSIFKIRQNGHEIKYLATVHSKNPYSYMYHTINIGLTVIQSEAMGIRLVSKESFGKKEEEIKDLKILLNDLDVDGVVCGAIKSKYQKSRIERVCKELKLELFAPLWGMKPENVLKELLKNKFEIIITAVAAEGFDESWLGRKIDKKCVNDLIRLNKKFGVDLCGEGGEFESFVLDCPLFKKRILIKKAEKIWNNNNGIFKINNVKLVEK